MSTAKPTLGYPTRTAAVVALRASGLAPREVATRIGIPVSSVAALECSARRGPGRSARQHGDVKRALYLPIGLLQRLAPHARKRGVSRETLAFLIVDKVVEDGLVDAVLDDGEDQPS